MERHWQNHARYGIHIFCIPFIKQHFQTDISDLEMKISEYMRENQTKVTSYGESIFGPLGNNGKSYMQCKVIFLEVSFMIVLKWPQ